MKLIDWRVKVRARLRSGGAARPRSHLKAAGQSQYSMLWFGHLTSQQPSRRITLDYCGSSKIGYWPLTSTKRLSLHKVCDGLVQMFGLRRAFGGDAATHPRIIADFLRHLLTRSATIPSHTHTYSAQLGACRRPLTLGLLGAQGQRK